MPSEADRVVLGLPDLRADLHAVLSLHQRQGVIPLESIVDWDKPDSEGRRVAAKEMIAGHHEIWELAGAHIAQSDLFWIVSKVGRRLRSMRPREPVLEMVEDRGGDHIVMGESLVLRILWEHVATSHS